MFHFSSSKDDSDDLHTVYQFDFASLHSLNASVSKSHTSPDVATPQHSSVLIGLETYAGLINKHCMPIMAQPIA